MKDVLLKHGISCDLLTKEQANRFLEFKMAVCEGNTEKIAETARDYLSFCNSREDKLDELRENVKEILKLLQSKIDEILPRADESVLAAFSGASKKDFESKHTGLMQVLTNTSVSFDKIAKEHLSFFNLDDINPSLDVKLLKIAVKEYGTDTEINLYGLDEHKIGEMSDFSIKRGNEILELKERFLVFSIKLDDIFMGITKKSPSVAPYLSQARELLSFLHKEELLNEQKRYKNE